MAVSLTDLCDRRSCFFSRDRFLIEYRRIFSRREFSPSIRKDVKVTIAVRPWVTELAAAKAERMNDEAQAIFSRTDEPGDQRKILDAAGGRHKTGPWEALDAGYTESHRAYHTWEHVAGLLEKLSEFSDLSTRSDIIAVSVFWHDVVYTTQNQDGGLRPDYENVRDCGKLFRQ